MTTAYATYDPGNGLERITVLVEEILDIPEPRTEHDGLVRILGTTATGDPIVVTVAQEDVFVGRSPIRTAMDAVTWGEGKRHA